MGANHLVFRKSLFDTLASTVAGPGDGLIEAGKLAKVLQVTVHQLVRQNRQRAAIRIFLVLIFLQDGFGKAVQVDGQPVVGLDGGHIHRVTFNVRPLQVRQIGIPEGSESAEAETVPVHSVHPVHRWTKWTDAYKRQEMDVGRWEYAGRWCPDPASCRCRRR